MHPDLLLYSAYDVEDLPELFFAMRKSFGEEVTKILICLSNIKEYSMLKKLGPEGLLLNYEVMSQVIWSVNRANIQNVLDLLKR